MKLLLFLTLFSYVFSSQANSIAFHKKDILIQNEVSTISAEIECSDDICKFVEFFWGHYDGPFDSLIMDNNLKNNVTIDLKSGDILYMNATVIGVARIERKKFYLIGSGYDFMNSVNLKINEKENTISIETPYWHNAKLSPLQEQFLRRDQVEYSKFLN